MSESDGKYFYPALFIHTVELDQLIEQIRNQSTQNRQRNNNNTNAQRRAQRVARQKKQLKEYNKKKDYQKQLTEDAIERREMLEEKNKLAGSRQMSL